jgi:hypothetical protein
MPCVKKANYVCKLTKEELQKKEGAEKSGGAEGTEMNSSPTPNSSSDTSGNFDFASFFSTFVAEI